MLVKKQTISIALAMLTAALMVSVCFAAAEAETVKVQGVVSVTKEADVVKSVMLTADADVYSVELDEKGMELAAMDGKKVEVEGTVSEKEGMKMLKVMSFKAVE